MLLRGWVQPRVSPAHILRRATPAGLRADRLKGDAMTFDGETIDKAEDEERLKTLLTFVLHVMADGRYHTLSEILHAVRRLAGKLIGTEASVSARLRDLRKEKFGGYIIRRERVSGGLFRYQLRDRASRERTAMPKGSGRYGLYYKTVDGGKPVFTFVRFVFSKNDADKWITEGS